LKFNDGDGEALVYFIHRLAFRFVLLVIEFRVRVRVCSSLSLSVSKIPKFLLNRNDPKPMEKSYWAFVEGRMRTRDWPLRI